MLIDFFSTGIEKTVATNLDAGVPGDIHIQMKLYVCMCIFNCALCVQAPFSQWLLNSYFCMLTMVIYRHSTILGVNLLTPNSENGSINFVIEKWLLRGIGIVSWQVWLIYVTPLTPARSKLPPQLPPQ